MDSRFLGLLADAAATLARLDERLSSAPAGVTEGWLARTLIREAVAPARLNGSMSKRGRSGAVRDGGGQANLSGKGPL